MKKPRIHRTEAEIAQIRAERAEKKAKREAEQAIQEELQKLFPSDKATRSSLKKLASYLRDQRKLALEKGIPEFTLPEEVKKAIVFAFTYLDYNDYRDELGEVSIEGLKIQDKEVKKFIFDFNDKLLARGKIDMGWTSRLLSKKYVSRYGWKLLRDHASEFSACAKIVRKFLEAWVDNPDVWKQWQRLAEEDGGPVDLREFFV